MSILKNQIVGDNEKKKKVRQKIGLGIFVLAGIILCVFGVYYLKKSFDSLSWDNVDGKIISSQIIKSETHVGRGSGSIYYSLNITYEYIVSGSRYAGDRIRIVNFDTGIKNYLQNIQSRFCTGITTKVFYDPKNPQNSVLEPGFNIGNSILFLLGLFFIVVGILLYFIGKPKSRSKILFKYLALFLSIIVFLLLCFFMNGLIKNTFFIKTIFCPIVDIKADLRFNECAKETNVDKKDSCYFGVAGTSLWSDPTICDKISNNSQYKAPCYTNMAQKNKDSTLCDKIPLEFNKGGIIYSNQQTKEQCYFMAK